MSLKDWHIEDILAAVRKKKKSLAALSRENGLAAGTLNNALRRPWPRGEKIIAQALGLTPGEIWPSRYSGGNKKQRKPLLTKKIKS
ncbi:helix-turn-helix domain-containing protein [Pantoea cypripedii]|uniref:Transcriptional regulator n=1 Tax=Pantoea cypripedii TaxID=55209 RepID=A0A1X1F0E4_PANCY|nr:helix-turn-helix transcriptional regulator [Pantoea cypripedii]MBP2198191.1 Ner family transcriptional regulator [Pantoea cypripedii]ORM95776.1 transcriptional regulator [Pantoea cypripedii]